MVPYYLSLFGISFDFSQAFLWQMYLIFVCCITNHHKIMIYSNALLLSQSFSGSEVWAQLSLSSLIFQGFSLKGLPGAPVSCESSTVEGCVSKLMQVLKEFTSLRVVERRTSIPGWPWIRGHLQFIAILASNTAACFIKTCKPRWVESENRPKSQFYVD